ncbi:amine oxidase [Tribonema minus]|uniref:Amine oxidase n=1 Tax=Tribonema minus TaxID=303371 RepID=A0A835ZF65_9STRA|nr:amine oxidase [Tribonema minus]
MRSFLCTSQEQRQAKNSEVLETDVVIIGSGIAGLCCGSLLAAYGHRVTVCESHYHAGGAAHAFKVKGYTFDSGPSLFSGLSINPSPNPLKHVLNAIGEDVDWLTYDAWGVFIPEGAFPSPIGPGPFARTLARFGGPGAQAQWDSLMAYLLRLSEATMGLPPFALRADVGAALTLAPYAPALLRTIASGPALQGPFSAVMERQNITDPFIRNWLNLMCFLLQGLPADGTLTAVMAYMVADWYREGVVLDYPRGGTGALIGALVRGVEKHEGGRVLTRAHVKSVLVEGGRAAGVRLRDGREVRASKAVVSNASIWDTLRLHVHLGVRASDLPPGSIDCHYAHVLDWSVPIDAPGNVIIVSIPSVLDPSLAPEGCHCVHAYTAGNEPYAVWEGLQEGTEEYERLKEERAKVLMDAVEKVFPGLEDRLEVRMIGTPRTHERFLRRDRGTYGPEIVAGKATFAGPGTPLKGLVCTGDSVWPGIGVPAVAASGTLVANSMVSVWQHLGMLGKIGFGGV